VACTKPTHLHASPSVSGTPRPVARLRSSLVPPHSPSGKRRTAVAETASRRPSEYAGLGLAGRIPAAVPAGAAFVAAKEDRGSRRALLLSQREIMSKRALAILGRRRTILRSADLVLSGDNK
jgi:hypothetical protein